MAANIITQFVLKQLGKKSLRKTGIATLNKASDPIVQSNVRNIEIQLKNLGINPKDLTSTDDVLKALNYHNALMNQHLKQQFKGLGLSKGVDDLAKKKDPFIGWNPRVQQDIDGIIKNLKSMEPMDAMKEANLVIGRKGKYKNLSSDEAQRILKDTDDHIFQRDIKPDPEDLASGGIAGPLHLYEGGRANYDKGGMSRRKFLQLFGGLASVPLLGKYFKWAKPLSKASGVITRGTDGIPTYAFDLIEVVKAKGTKEIMEGLYRKTPPSTKYNYKGVEVVEDGMGNTSVTKQQEKMGRWQYGEDDVLVEPYVDREIGFEIRKGEVAINKKGQPVQTPDEYTENTAKLQGDPEGGTEVSEVLEYIDDADHLELQKIADEGSFLTQKRKRDKITRIKEAEGGRIGYESGKKVWPPKEPNPYGGFDPGTLPKNFMNKMPLIDPRLRDLIKEYKKRKGLAEILGV